MPVAPHVGRCEECDRKVTIWMPVENGTRYGRCRSCSEIRKVTRTYENIPVPQWLEDMGVAVMNS